MTPLCYLSSLYSTSAAMTVLGETSPFISVGAQPGQAFKSEIPPDKSWQSVSKESAQNQALKGIYLIIAYLFYSDLNGKEDNLSIRKFRNTKTHF